MVELVRAIGCRKCQGLIGLHNFSGADWGGKFVGITKKTWVRKYMDLSDDDPALNCFIMLGESHLPTAMNGNELPEEVKPLEHFVCRAYSPKGPTTLPALRWEMFQSRNQEGKMLPPTRAALMLHITLTN